MTEQKHNRLLIKYCVALVLLFTLAGCTAIPSSGRVHAGLASLDQAERSVQFNPSTPVAGASPEDIVRGFVRAASSAVDDYAIAREFLDPAYSDNWDPTLGVTIDEGTQTYNSGIPVENTDSGTLSLTVVSKVDEQGKLVPSAPGTKELANFELVEVAGEWRISSAPAGVILDRTTFRSVWTSKQVYYLSADKRLIADTRWFLNRATIATQIVNALLSGPSNALSESLHTAFPAGTTLVSGSVPVDRESLAVIDFSPELLEADPVTMEHIKRQVSASLQSVPGISRYQFTVNGTVVDEGPVIVQDISSVASETQYVSVMHEGSFGAIVSGEIQPFVGLSQRIEASLPNAITLNHDRTSATTRNDSGVSWVNAEESVVVDRRNDLLEPSLDRFGYVWSFSATSPTGMQVFKPGETTLTLGADWAGSRSPVAARVSADGTRLALLFASNRNSVDGEPLSEVVMLAIVRDELGLPLALGSTSVTQLWALGTPKDLDWIDTNRFVVLSEGNVSSNVTVGELGRFPQEPSRVAGGEKISGSGSRVLVRVLGADQRLFAPQGSGWQAQLADVQLLAKQG